MEALRLVTGHQGGKVPTVGGMLRFHALGLIKQWGSDVQKMTAACRDAGLAAPVFEKIATRFRVMIATARIGRPTLDETDETILARLAGGKGLLTSEIAKAIGLTPRATRTCLARLAADTDSCANSERDRRIRSDATSGRVESNA